jgi:hypothetical protein
VESVLTRPPDASPKRLLRYAIQEVQPLLSECHRSLPSSGTLAMHIVLVGAPGIGTIVETVEIADNDDGSSAVFEPSFTECMRETLHAIELPPMAAADRWDVRYPFAVGAVSVKAHAMHSTCSYEATGDVHARTYETEAIAQAIDAIEARARLVDTAIAARPVWLAQPKLLELAGRRARQRVA